MTLFAYLAAPLFVLAVAGHAHASGRGGGWDLLHVYTAAALLAMPAYPLVELLAAAFPPVVGPRMHYARLLAFDHGLPLLAASAASLAVYWFRGRGRAPDRLRAVLLVAGLGGFFSVFSILDQFANHADPSMTRLVLMPMLRLAAATAAAYLMVRAARGAWWWAAAVPAVPCVTAGIAYAGTFRQPELAAVGATALLAVAVPLVFAGSVSEAHDDPAS